ncbi:IucA/IucC family siderophore biosynthesis protein [Candidatus Sororendozoicomonas aggregata]|uniref:IucA/IucC family protein n=1 Tax=Candidatus Sororendozoicomonas aggregata TaxID=3073239 RepID=UPI002ED07901
MQFLSSRRPSELSVQPSTEATVSHLTPEIWAKANCQLVGKMISEFAHERLLHPEFMGQTEPWTDYALKSGNNIHYRFKARALMLEHWWIDLSTLRKTNNQQSAPLDAMAFVAEFSAALGLSSDILPTYLEEIASTLYSAAFKLSQSSPGARELVFSDYQTIEAAMTEGHPSFVANSGRIGFSAEDYRRHAPETGTNIRLLWVAARKSRSVFSVVDSLSYEQLIAEELGEKTLGTYAETMAAKGLDLNDYVLMPVHPWQWRNKLVYANAADIAASDLVFLGEGEDHYQPQQSVRTFFNTSCREKRYIKVALSILNMGFMRGLSPYYMKNTPAINQWVGQVIDNDPFLVSTGFQVLQEVAAVGFVNSRFEAVTDATSPYRKMLSALWRESPMDKISPHQQLMTMAALLHVDSQGNALLPALIKQSGLGTKSWLQHYLRCYLTPLLHCFYAYDMAFMPHGENLILVMENHRPVKAFMKDIAEEVVIMNTDTVLPEPVRRITADIPEAVKILSIFTDIFDGIFRYIARILLAYCNFSEQDFWYEVAQCIHQYQADHPDMADKFARYDLFMPEFTHSCLNRLQLQNNKQMVDLTNPSKNLKFVGTLVNPVAQFASSDGSQ